MSESHEDAPLDMWLWWSCEYGVLQALEVQYPALLARDRVLATAVGNIRVNMWAIDARMKELKEAAGGGADE